MTGRSLPGHVWVPSVYCLVAALCVVVPGLLFTLTATSGVGAVATAVVPGLVFVAVTTVVLALLMYRARPGVSPSFRDVVDHIPAAVLLLDLPAGRILHANRAAADLFGYPLAELQGLPLSALHVDDADCRRVESAILDRTETAGGVRGECRMSKRGGNTFLSAQEVALWSDEQRRRYAVIVIRDAAHPVSPQAEIRQTRTMHAVGQLTGGIAHDFNNALAVILGNMEQLDDRLRRAGIDAEETAEILQATERAIGLNEKLLAFSRRQPARRDGTDVNTLIRAGTRLLQQTVGPKITLELALGEAVWPLPVDPADLEACVLNLAVNGRESMPDGGTLGIATYNRTLTMDDDLAAGDYVVLGVSYTGRGMASDGSATRGDPLSPSAAADRQAGAVLDAARRFAAGAGGRMIVCGREGGGTTIELLLPRHVDSDTIVPAVVDGLHAATGSIGA